MGRSVRTDRGARSWVIAMVVAMLALFVTPISNVSAQDGVIDHVEAERSDMAGANDERATGELIAGFGSGVDEVPLALISGHLADGAAGRPVVSAGEDDGAIDLATPLAVASGEVVTISDTIGNGPHAVTGDYDHYQVFLAPGQTLVATASAAPDSDLDPVLTVFDDQGEIVAENDDTELEERAAGVLFLSDIGGAYSVSVSGCCLPQTDPFDSGSGAGAQSVGNYLLTIGVDVATVGSIEPVASTEPDNTIPDANVLELLSPGSATATGDIEVTIDTADVGDGDFWSLGFLAQGETLVVDIDTDGMLDSLVLLYDESGAIIDGNDDDGVSLDSYLFTTIPADGAYYVAVLSCCDNPLDPFDGSSIPPGFGGPYSMLVQVGIDPAEGEGDRDVYLVDLEVGDVMSAAFAGSVNNIEVRDPGGVLRMGSDANASFIYPPSSPLRHQGHNGIDHVAGQSGIHEVVVSGAGGRYRGELRVARASADPQMVFLDFDGATINPEDFGSPFGPTDVSPLKSFLFRWDLGPESEAAVIDAVTANVRENFETIAGIPTGIVVLNSKDDLDPGDMAGVTRIVVGGSVEETTIFALGIAKSIDPGNLDRDETGLVMLDGLSDRPEFALFENIELGPGVTKVDLVGEGVGNVVSHELGHLFGLWHTSDFNKIPSLMDTGGAPLVIVGPDGLFGTADDVDIDFLIDEFNDYEGFFGFQDVVSRLLVGLGTAQSLEGQVLPETEVPTDVPVLPETPVEPEIPVGDAPVITVEPGDTTPTEEPGDTTPTEEPGETAPVTEPDVPVT